MKYAVIAGLTLFLSGCADESTQPSLPKSFQPIYDEVPEGWSTFHLYVLRHKSGECILILDPPGDGGGAITTVDKKMCEYHERPEK